jgi:phosphotriesterase-related protein
LGPVLQRAAPERLPQRQQRLGLRGVTAWGAASRRRMPRASCVLAGVPPHKISINHIDVEIDLAYCMQLCATGAFIEFDDFGKEYTIDKRDRGFAGGVFARDIERVRAVKALVDAGYLHNLLLANDVCLKTLLHKYGGWGYDHVLTHIVPMLIEEGLSEAQIDVLLRENPRRFLDVK